ncbi:TorD/DmsD family molecular chaperone [Halalkalirubrum salinum]|uniref:TorD/DmsD family molecular chaperone n=1 Tax=Halalkalirubrum salinum TaxID=2563889 RepID=UPI001484DB62|nr:molecular chaperone TorD family protein [Halalkalirubrum salinum]
MNETDGADDQYAPERRRARTYQLLAACFGEPSDDLHDRLAEESPETVAVDVSGLDAAMTDRKSLRLDHARLFVGPFELEAPPYESVYVDAEDRVMTDATEAVEAEYRRVGVDMNLSEPADHIIPELEFVYLLVATEIEALEGEEFEAAVHLLERQYEFLKAHLGRWISEIADNMRANADTEFYRLLGEELQTFVEGDGQRLADRLNALEEGDELIPVLNGEEPQ